MTESISANLRRTVYFSGRVQGVGFRFTAATLAARFEVTGFVRNLDDGRVELVAEGEPAELDRFIQAIHARMTDNIDTADTTDRPAEGGFTAFAITR